MDMSEITLIARASLRLPPSQQENDKYARGGEGEEGITLSFIYDVSFVDVVS